MLLLLPELLQKSLSFAYLQSTTTAAVRLAEGHVATWCSSGCGRNRPATGPIRLISSIINCSQTKTLHQQQQRCHQHQQHIELECPIVCNFCVVVVVVVVVVIIDKQQQ